MKKGQEYTGKVVRMDFPNKGIVEVQTEEGTETAAVKNALPGQTVRFGVNKKRGGKAEGHLKEVAEHAPCEDPENACPHMGQCGGCLYQGFPYTETLKVKEGQIKRLLGGYTDGAVYDGIIPSPVEDGYRNKMEYTFGDEIKDGPMTLGLHKRGSFYDIMTVADCRIADADFGRILEYTLQFFTQKGILYYHRMRHTGILRHLLVRKAVKTGEILVALVAASGTVSADKHSSDASVPEVGTEQNDAEKNSAVRLCGQQEQANGDKVQTENSGLTEEMLREWADGLRALTLTGSFAGILHIVNDNFADAVKCDRMEILYGQDYFMEELLGLRFRVSTFSFFQTNSLGAEKLYSLVRDYLMQEGVKGTVFDLYSGTGTIAQLLSPAAEQVIGVEIVEEAVEAAKENAALNGLTNCSFIAGDVLKVLDDVTEKPDYIILDPPRDGIHPKALKKILDYGVDSLVYISCKPTSLARDMEAISAAGYRIIRWGMVDMFPYTGNVEVVSLLQKMSNTRERTITLDVEMEDYHRIKNGTGVTADATD